MGRLTLRLVPGSDGRRSRVGKYVLVHRPQPDGSWRRAVDIYDFDGMDIDGEQHTLGGVRRPLLLQSGRRDRAVR